MNRIKCFFIIFSMVFANHCFATNMSCTSFVGVKKTAFSNKVIEMVEAKNFFSTDVTAALKLLSIELQYIYIAKEAHGVAMKDIAAELGVNPTRVTQRLKKAKREVNTWAEKYLKDKAFFENLAVSHKKHRYKKNYDTFVNWSLGAVSSTVINQLETTEASVIDEVNWNLQLYTLRRLSNSLKDPSLLDEAQSLDQISTNHEQILENIFQRMTAVLKDLESQKLISTEQSESLSAYYIFLYETLLRDPNLSLMQNPARFRYSNFNN